MMSPSSSVAPSGAAMRKTRLRRPNASKGGGFSGGKGGGNLSKTAFMLIFCSVCCLICFTAVPIYILESMDDPQHHPNTVQGVHRLVNFASRMNQKFRQPYPNAPELLLQNNQPKHQFMISKKDYLRSPEKAEQLQNMAQQKAPQLAKEENDLESKEGLTEKQLPPDMLKEAAKKKVEESLTKQQVKPKYTLHMLKEQYDQAESKEVWSVKPLARGLAGRPMSETPALTGAKRGHVANCEINVNSLAYWNSPVGTFDLEFKTPFARPDGREQYISFTPDLGGWNNVRMSMEILFVLAGATGRTLVLPPKEPLYLLDKDKNAKYRGFIDFFPIEDPSFPIKVISMEEFLTKPFVHSQLDKPEFAGNKTKILKAGVYCQQHKTAEVDCHPLRNFLLDIGFNPKFNADNQILIFDEPTLQGKNHSAEAFDIISQRAGERTPVFWNSSHFEHDHFHLPTDNIGDRLLEHFYNYIFFPDPKISNHYKRFVRDFLHYNDAIHCAAGKIVKALQKEGAERNVGPGPEGGGGYSAMHIRHGDFQFKNVIISAQEWYDNTKEVWNDKEIMYIATDERNKTYFDDLAAHYDLRFLDDYWDLANLSSLDPNYMGMIDTIVASRGRAFAGTFFSTFTGYINRLRGYHGMSMLDSWYSFLERKTKTHVWEDVNRHAYQFEWPDGWVGIDADVLPKRDVF